jgi:hypothetical protein
MSDLIKDCTPYELLQLNDKYGVDIESLVRDHPYFTLTELSVAHTLGWLYLTHDQRFGRLGFIIPREGTLDGLVSIQYEQTMMVLRLLHDMEQFDRGEFLVVCIEPPTYIESVKGLLDYLVGFYYTARYRPYQRRYQGRTCHVQGAV